MPTLTAILVSSLAGWLVEAPLRALLGPVGSIVCSLLLGTVSFYGTRQYLLHLRDGA